MERWSVENSVCACVHCLFYSIIFCIVEWKRNSIAFTVACNACTYTKTSNKSAWKFKRLHLTLFFILFLFFSLLENTSQKQLWLRQVWNSRMLQSKIGSVCNSSQSTVMINFFFGHKLQRKLMKICWQIITNQ